MSYSRGLAKVLEIFRINHQSQGGVATYFTLHDVIDSKDHQKVNDEIVPRISAKGNDGAAPIKAKNVDIEVIVINAAQSQNIPKCELI